jgi:serine/threonine protein kinase
VERLVGPYRFLERLGEGGLGEVYRARDTRLGRTVAVKCVPAAIAASPGPRARLLTVVHALKALSHPRIAELYDVVEEGDDLFLVSEYVEGETLAQIIGGRPLNPRRAAELAAQIADALATAHAAGVLHLDLRPETVIVTRKGQVKLLDIGLSDFSRTGEARRRVAAGASSVEASPTVSLGYLSPEQALGENEDARSDIFSLGTIFYEMLTGEAPFHGRDAGATVISVLGTTPPPASQRNPAVPRYYDAVAARMLAKSLQGRYDNAATAAAALRGLADRAPEGAVPVPAGRRRRWPLVALVLAVMAVAILFWLLRPVSL